jgi:hypothetical protein
VTQPLSWFVEAFLADSPAALARYAALAAGVNAALLGLVYLLDANHLEASALASARAYARLQRLRGRDVPDEVAGGGRGVRFGLPPLPRLGGVGPVLWRQLTTALRNPLRLITLAVPVALVLAGVATGPERDEPEAVLLVPVLVGSVLLLPTLLANVVPFDFRGDVDRMAALKALPLSAWRLTLGQVAAPVIVVSGVQWLALTVLGRLLQSDDASLAAAAALAVPINFLVFGVENLLFLLFPTRLHGGTPGDFQALGRSVLLLAARVVVLGAAAVAAGAAAFVLLLVTGSAAAALGAAWLVLAAAGAVVVPFVALAFEAFDVARDVPA